MLANQPSARTSPALRSEVARSSERTGVLAARYGVGTGTVREWHRRGGGAFRRRHLLVGTDRRSRSVHLAFEDDTSDRMRAVATAEDVSTPDK